VHQLARKKAESQCLNRLFLSMLILAAVLALGVGYYVPKP
jgi:hypothetical protein